METRAGATRAPKAVDLRAAAQCAMILLRGTSMRETLPRENTDMQRSAERAGARWTRRIALGMPLMLVVGACAVRGSGQTAAAKVRPGISVLLTDSIHLVRGRRVGLLTNQTGIDEHGESDIERLRGAEARAAGIQLARLFSSDRMITDYLKVSYLPAVERWHALSENDSKRAIDLLSLVLRRRSPRHVRSSRRTKVTRVP